MDALSDVALTLRDAVNLNATLHGEVFKTWRDKAGEPFAEGCDTEALSQLK